MAVAQTVGKPQERHGSRFACKAHLEVVVADVISKGSGWDRKNSCIVIDGSNLPAAYECEVCGSHADYYIN